MIKHGDICKHSVVHCFTGTKETLQRYRVMIETDAPYLTPRNVKGLDRTNVPQNNSLRFH